MIKRIFPYFTVIFFVLVSTIILWLPFLLRFNSLTFDYISKSYDGPLYVIPAKTVYDPVKIDIPGKGLILSLPLSAKYFAAHLPLYPLFIRLFRETKLFGNYLSSMIFVNLFFTFFLAGFFYFFLKKFKLSKKPLLLVFIFLFLPRFLVVRSIGAPESLFMFLILLSLYFFEREKYLLAGVFGGLATMTKTPAILLFFSYFLVLVEKWLAPSLLGRTKMVPIKNYLNYFWIFLIPLSLMGVFGLYWKQFGNFFAYFHSGDNIHLVYPFSVFNFKAPWVGTAWLEDVIFYFFIYLLTVFYLKESKYRSLFYFSLVFFTATVFVQHRDIARYSLPLWPMAVIAFEKFLTSKKFLFVFIIMLPAIYLYAWNFLLYNIMPISDWSPFL